MKACIIIVGDEILIGQVTDTNSGWIAQQLFSIGISVVSIMTVSDKLDDIQDALRKATSCADIILMTGGLGPTKDDITKIALADFLGVGMYFDMAVYDRIKTMFAKLNRTLSPHHHNQCNMPEGVELIHNSMGTAPGMLFRKDDNIIISMPGVPFEMKAIMNEYVVSMLQGMTKQHLFHYTINTACTGETIIENLISAIVDSMPSHISVAYLPAIGEVKLRLTGQGMDYDLLKSEIMAFAGKITDRLGNIVYGFNDTNLETALMHLCINKKIKVTTAESCTGGSVAARIVSISGSSDYFKGSIVAYSNEIKHRILHVGNDTLEQYGAVSERTVTEMVDGALDGLQADVAVAISGIAGPGGGTPEKPVGTIWICAGNKSQKDTFLLKSGKNRQLNIQAATQYALNMLRLFIIKNIV